MADEKQLSKEEVSDLKGMGYTPRGIGFAKDNKFVSNRELDEAVGQIKIKDSVEDIRRALVAISSSLGLIENSLTKFVSKKQAEEYRKEEAQLEAIPQRGARVTEAVREDTGESFMDTLKGLLLNPAMIAAFSGLAYMLLPREVKEKIDSFFSGFTEGIGESFKELDSFKIAILSAAAGLSTFLGAKVLQSIGDAITSVVSLISKASKTFGGFKRSPGKIKEALKQNKAAVAGGVVAAGTAGALMARDEEAAQSIREPSPQGPAPSMSEPMDKASPASTRGVLSRQSTPESLPTITGDDSSVMSMIKVHEGVRTRPYKDSLGLWTVGVGHLIGDGRSLPPEYNREFSMDEIDRIFAKDYAHHKKAAEKIPGYDKLDEKGKAALIDLTFNMGPAWYKKWPRLQESLKEGDTEAAASSLENSLWYRQVGRRGPTIVSLIRASEVTGVPSTGALASTPAMPTFEASQPQSGAIVMAASEQTEQLYGKSSTQTQNNIIDASRIATGKEGVQPPPPIPSPVANRGSLAIGTKHYSTA